LRAWLPGRSRVAGGAAGAGVAARDGVHAGGPAARAPAGAQSKEMHQIRMHATWHGADGAGGRGDV